jgi:hypothetical protein
MSMADVIDFWKATPVTVWTRLQLSELRADHASPQYRTRSGCTGYGRAATTASR